ncbi:Subtilisin-like protein [Penicillium desertorum]|uniref:Subtilisin-like protein n=1 Tax=Penicillium desertorum TaxID=1303715 RepID=A0A9X0BIG0_9EURO|nr:Subtilisin-like protein [Penicillium desertorum]
MKVGIADEAGCVLASLDYIKDGIEKLRNCSNGQCNTELGKAFTGLVELIGLYSTILGVILGLQRQKLSREKSYWESQKREATFKGQLGPQCGRFRDAVREISSEVRSLAIYSDLDHDTAPWNQKFLGGEGDAYTSWRRHPWPFYEPGDQKRNEGRKEFFLLAARKGHTERCLNTISSLLKRTLKECREELEKHSEGAERNSREIVRRTKRDGKSLQQKFNILGDKKGLSCGFYKDYLPLLSVGDISPSSSVDVIEVTNNDDAFILFYNFPSASSNNEAGTSEEKRLPMLYASHSVTQVPPCTTYGRVDEYLTHQCHQCHQCHQSSPHPEFWLKENAWSLTLTAYANSGDAYVASVSSLRDSLLSSGAALPTQKKLLLAENTALSILYLWGTHWLKHQWTSDDVYLICVEDKHGSGSWDVKPMPLFKRSTDSQDADLSTVSSGIARPTIVQLGKYLIELSCGAPWSLLENLTGYSGRSVQADTLTLAYNGKIAPGDQPFAEEGSSYCEAVSNCFRFGRDDLSTCNEDELRSFVYTNIVRPLKFARQDFRRRDRFPYRQETFDISSPPTPPRLFDIYPMELSKELLADNWWNDYRTMQSIFSAKRSNNPNLRPKVAILDTGVDVTAADLRRPWERRQIIYKNFTTGHGAPEDDDDGHGTAITSLLLKAAPGADVYVGKVAFNGKCDASSLCTAIRWAASEKGVHIISLSLGFHHYDKALEPIRNAIMEAYAKDVIIFAAAHNEGNNEPVAFPASMDEVICVGSTDGRGNRSSFSPEGCQPWKMVRTLGEGLVCFQPRSEANTLIRKSGTSFATPIAAGIAAFVLQNMWPETNQDYFLFKQLRTKAGMSGSIKALIKFFVETG